MHAAAAGLASDAYPSTKSEKKLERAVTAGGPKARGRNDAYSIGGRKPMNSIVNRTLARQLFGRGDPIGARPLRGRENEDVLEIAGCKGREDATLPDPWHRRPRAPGAPVVVRREQRRQ
jgi:hypothetical protein